MNLREMIKRKITYSKVTVTYEGKSYSYLVYGETTLNKEMKKVLKDYTIVEEIPRVSITTVTEKRAISLEDFIKHSILISEGEDN